MMAFYVYGDNVLLVQNKVSSLLSWLREKTPGAKVVSIEKNSFNPLSFQEKARSLSFFPETNIYLINQLKSFSPKDKEVLFSFLSTKKMVIFWDKEKTSLTVTLKKHFPQLKTFYFPQPKIIFKLLESIFPGNQSIFLPLFQKVVKEQPLELVFYFLKKHCHQLLVISPKSNLPPWQKKKLLSQKEKFPEEKLISFYSQLITLEYKNRKGEISDLELALVNLLATL